MRVTVAIEDGTIIVDGSAKKDFDFSQVDPKWHAIQWFGDKGWIEVKVGDRIWLDSIDLVQPFVDMYVAQVPPDPEPVNPVPDSITRRQCAMMMFSLQMISGPEAIAMTQSGIPPFAVQQYLDTLPEPQRTFAIMDFAATNYYRSNPLLLSLMQINNMTEQQVDEFFIGAAQL